jgi:hypothetical protein
MSELPSDAHCSVNRQVWKHALHCNQSVTDHTHTHTHTHTDLTESALSHLAWKLRYPNIRGSFTALRLFDSVSVNANSFPVEPFDLFAVTE